MVRQFQGIFLLFLQAAYYRELFLNENFTEKATTQLYVWKDIMNWLLFFFFMTVVSTTPGMLLDYP